MRVLPITLLISGRYGRAPPRPSSSSPDLRHTLGVDVEQRVGLLPDRAVLDDQVELADERREGAGFGDLAKLPLQRFTDALVRVGAEDLVDAVRAILVGQVELLRKPHVREHENQVATLFSAQDPHVVGEIPFGPGERDAARVAGRLSGWRERIVEADKADADAAAIEDR